MTLMHRIVRGLPAVALAVAVAVSASAQSQKDLLSQANAALQAGEADKALSLLSSLYQSGANPAEAHNLECRVRYTLEQWNAAADQCQRAVNQDGQNSNYHMWLGRALGEKANHASFMSAYSLGKQVRTEFEAAARLNPHNAEALADLGEFYYSAPGVVGGGSDKAARVASQLDKIDGARAHELHARIAEQRKDYGTAEREFKQAIAVSGHPAFQWMSLASFYRRRGRLADMDSTVQSGVSAAARDKRAGVALYDGASILIRTKHEPALAAKMLQDYLSGPVKTEEAPAFVAHIRLARLKEQLGDSAAAKREWAAVWALTHAYKPAQDAKH